MAQGVFEVGVAVVVVLVRGVAVGVEVVFAIAVGVGVGVGVVGVVVLRKRGAVNNVSAMLYHTIVRLAEEGRRVIRVELPSRLYDEYMLDDGMPQMMRTLCVAVVSSNRSEPEFFSEERK